MEIKDQIEKLNARLARCIPPRETWTLADEALPRSADMTLNAMTAQEQEHTPTVCRREAAKNCREYTVAYTCPEGHYFHLPYTWLKPMVLDKSLRPAGYGEWGRFAFLDGLAGSYPGFVFSGDEVRMHERCPVCDLPGPVLEPEIKRAKGEEVRGCTEVLSRVFAQTLQGGS